MATRVQGATPDKRAGQWRRPRSFTPGDGGDDSAVGPKGGKKKGPTRALPFPRSFTFGQSARDVLSKADEQTVAQLIESMNKPQPPQQKAAPKVWDEEVLEYAQYFGIDPKAEPHLMWIAEEGMDPPLPDGWGEHIDGDGRPYFYCKATKTSTYEHPYDPYFKDLVARGRAAYEAKLKPPAGPARPKPRGGAVMFPVAGGAARAGPSLDGSY